MPAPRRPPPATGTPILPVDLSEVCAHRGHTRQEEFVPLIAAKAGGLKSFDFVTEVRISPPGGSVERQRCNRAYGLCARTRAPCSNAARPWRMDTRGV